MLQGYCWKLQALLCMLGRPAEAQRVNAYSCSLCLQLLAIIMIRVIKPLLYMKPACYAPNSPACIQHPSPKAQAYCPGVCCIKDWNCLKLPRFLLQPIQKYAGCDRLLPHTGA